MARFLYGATTADYAVSSAGAPVAGAVLTVYTAPAGTQITDLLDVTDATYTPGGAITQVTSDANGTYPFYGPDNENGTLYLKTTVSSVDYWYAVNPSNLGDIVQSVSGTVGTLSTSVATQGTNLTTLAGRVTTLEGLTPNTPAWTAITGKPATYPPTAHTHTTTDITDMTTTGKAVAKAATPAAGLAALGGLPSTFTGLQLGTTATTAATGNHTHNATSVAFTPTGAVTATNAQDAIVQAANLGSGGGATDWASLTGKPATYPPSAHTQSVDTLSDASAASKLMLKAASNTAILAQIGAMPSTFTGLQLGTTPGTALAGDTVFSIDEIDGAGDALATKVDSGSGPLKVYRVLTAGGALPTGTIPEGSICIRPNA